MLDIQLIPNRFESEKEKEKKNDTICLEKPLSNIVERFQYSQLCMSICQLRNDIWDTESNFTLMIVPYSVFDFT